MIGLLLSLSLCADVDLSQAVVVAAESMSSPEKKAVQMLIEEIEKRTQIRLQRASAWPPGTTTPVIAIGSTSGEKAPARAESYRVRVDRKRSAVLVAGHDPRGVLFGTGRLLRSLALSKRKISLDDSLDIASSPQTPIRGHQLGYRPKTNSYDGWTLAMWEQYIRDLVVFGTNAIELMPPRTDDAADSPHFPLPQMDMMIAMSRVLDEYGLDVWIWYPAMDRNYEDPKTVEFALGEWGEVFRKLPRVDAVFVPGGDPGHTQPRVLMALLEKQAQNLRRFHPKGQMWVAPQGFNTAWTDEFYELLGAKPAWLTGIVYGPQVRTTLAECRRRTPEQYPIRHYPDITHSSHSQYPVPDWDLAFALTLAREPINPRPLDQATIFRALQKHTKGFITYSEGCNDDVNKIIWSALGWDEKARVPDVLREYSRYFIGPQYEDSFAQGLLALERNWRGPALANTGIYTTLGQFQALEAAASPQDMLNWRFQQALYRAYYDAYVRSRLLYESNLEEQALAKLRDAAAGSLAALRQAEDLLDRAIAERPSVDWRTRVFALAEALFQSVRMQLSVRRYRAIGVGRGANLDTIDVPLNNRLWLKQQFAEIRLLESEPERLRRIAAITGWDNPGPGGFYDDLGNPSRQPHLERGVGFERDPAFFESSFAGFPRQAPGQGPISWWTQAESLYDTRLKMRYTDLDPKAQYKVKVVYAGDNRTSQVRMLADESEVHALIPTKLRPLEFDIPAETTRDGELVLSWHQTPGQGGSGRGCQVAEVWLMRK